MDILGVEPEVVTGDQEAQLSFDGATKELVGSDHLEKPYLVVDIGGGSTEFVVGDDRVRQLVHSEIHIPGINSTDLGEILPPL